MAAIGVDTVTAELKRVNASNGLFRKGFRSFASLCYHTRLALNRTYSVKLAAAPFDIHAPACHPPIRLIARTGMCLYVNTSQLMHHSSRLNHHLSASQSDSESSSGGMPLYTRLTGGGYSTPRRTHCRCTTCGAGIQNVTPRPCCDDPRGVMLIK